MVVVIAIAFILSWSPQFIVTIVTQFQKVSFLRRQNFLFTMLTTHFCGFMSSCINPFIYTVMSDKFRRSFKQIISYVLFCNLPRNVNRAFGNGSSELTPTFTSSREQGHSCQLQLPLTTSISALTLLRDTNNVHSGSGNTTRDKNGPEEDETTLFIRKNERSVSFAFNDDQKPEEENNVLLSKWQTNLFSSFRSKIISSPDKMLFRIVHEQ